MGAKPNLCVCMHCGKIMPREYYETTCFVKCEECQKAGKTEFLELQEFLKQKRKMLEMLQAR